MKPMAYCNKTRKDSELEILKQSEDTIWLRCKSCGHEWSDDIGIWAHLFNDASWLSRSLNITTVKK